MALRYINNSDLLELLCVTPPYFALEDIYIDDQNKQLSATIQLEQPLGKECGPISTSEAGRHLAIAGQSHIAIYTENKTYCVVEKAEVARLDSDYTDKKFDIITKILSLNKRNAIVIASLYTTQKKLVYEFVLTYIMIPSKVFARKYKSIYVEQSVNINGNPYLASPTLNTVSVTDTSLLSKVQPLQPFQCAGHFPNFPFVPIAILMQAVLISIGNLLSKQYSDPIFTLLEATMDAYHLVPANADIEIFTEIIQCTDLLLTINCQISSYHKSVSKVHTKVRISSANCE